MFQLVTIPSQLLTLVEVIPSNTDLLECVWLLVNATFQLVRSAAVICIVELEVCAVNVVLSALASNFVCKSVILAIVWVCETAALPSNRVDKLIISVTVWLCGEGANVVGLSVRSFQLLAPLLLSINDFNTRPWFADKAQSVALEVRLSTMVTTPLPPPVEPAPYAATSCSPIRFSLTLKLLVSSIINALSHIDLSNLFFQLSTSIAVIESNTSLLSCVCVTEREEVPPI